MRASVYRSCHGPLASLQQRMIAHDEKVMDASF